jgi:hypothetical protein
MSDTQPTEVDKREAVEIARLLGAGAGIFDIGLGTRVGQTAKRVARIRADAVKAERDRCVRKVRDRLSVSPVYRIAMQVAIEAVLSDDQEAHLG